MKKIIALCATLFIIFAIFSVSVSAAGTLGANEQKVMDLLSSVDEYTLNGKVLKFKIPKQYVNQAKNFFASTEGDITAEQRDEIIKFVNVGKTLVEKTTLDDNKYYSNGIVDIAKMPREIRKQVLKAGQDACAVVGLSLIFDDKHVVITDKQGATLFEDRPIVKTTGASAMPVFLMGAFVLLVGGALLTAKRAKIFKK